MDRCLSRTNKAEYGQFRSCFAYVTIVLLKVFATGAVSKWFSKCSSKAIKCTRTSSHHPWISEKEKWVARKKRVGISIAMD